MITKTIAYTDYEGKQREETHYFHLSKFEATEILLTLPEGVAEELNNVKDANDVNEDAAKKLLDKIGNQGIIDFLKKIVLKSYGIKNPDDTRRFIKSDKISEEFAQTGAYDELMYSMVTNSDEAAAFINGLVLPYANK